MLLLAASCEQSTLEPLTGMFPKPTESALTTLAKGYEGVDEGGLRIFNLSLSGDGITLNAALVGTVNNTYIPATSYTAAELSAAKTGNYVIGQTTVTDGGTTKRITDGSITVSYTEAATENDYNYTISTIIFAEDDSCYKLEWAGILHFEPEPPLEMTQLLSASSAFAYGGGPSCNLVLATDGVSSYFDMATYSNVYTGTGNYLSIDLYTADGKLHEGTYGPCAVGGTLTEGTFGIGYDNYAYAAYGIILYNQGTCWFTLDNSVSTADKILDGTITVTFSGDNFTLLLESSTVNVTYTGTKPAALL